MTVKFGEVTLKTEIEGDVLSLSAGERRRLFKILDAIRSESRADAPAEPKRRRKRQAVLAEEAPPVLEATPPELVQVPDPLDEGPPF